MGLAGQLRDRWADKNENKIDLNTTIGRCSDFNRLWCSESFPFTADG